MRKSERLRQLELSVARLEVSIDLMASAINSLLESQIKTNESNLDSGKWYKPTSETP